MNRNMNLIRDILCKVESYDLAIDTEEITITGYSRREIEYHFLLLLEAGLLHAQIDDTRLDDEYGRWVGLRLTWSGHEFLDAARNNEIWDKAMHTVATRTGAVTFEILKTLLVEIGRQYLFPI